MACFHVVGNDAAIAYAVQAGQLELNVMMPIIAHNLLGALSVLTNTLRLLRERCVAGITADAERCRAYADATIGLATILNPVVGYEAAAKVAKDAMATGRSMVESAKATGVLSAEDAKRMEERVAYVQDALPHESFEFKTDEKILLNRKDQPWPKDLPVAR